MLMCSALVMDKAYSCPPRASAQSPGQGLSPSRLGRSLLCLSESIAMVCRALSTGSWRRSERSSLAHQRCMAPVLVSSSSTRAMTS